MQNKRFDTKSSSNMLNQTPTMNSTTRMLVFLALIIALAEASSEIQPPNQAPNSHSVNSVQPNQHQTDQQKQQPASATPTPTLQGASVQQASSAQQRLPNINIYINKNEIRKLLGIDTRINYVTNGNINTYPLGFTIPLGYNQSDIIFTWQNLGQTNVNYSISLVIGNIQAVDPPLINITRSGLIPKHEQVFKITLPCSGRVTDEVDVQVLINIVGFVSGDETEANSPILEQTSSQQGETNVSTSTTEFMQSDQADDSGNAKLRLVSHTLAIKRKKICTMHPVQVAVQPRPQPQPAQVQTLQRTQQQQQQQQQPPTLQQTKQVEAAVNRWPQVSPPDSTQHMHSLSKPGIHEQSSEAPAAGTGSASSPSSEALDNDPLEKSTRKLEQYNLIPPRIQPPFSGQAQQPGVIATSQTTSIPTTTARKQQSASDSAPGFYPNWPHPSGRIPTNPGGSIPAENPINDIIVSLNRQAPQPIVGANNNPLVLTLIGLSLLISFALVIVIILGSSHRTPLDKISTLTSCILRRTPASQANKCKSPMAGAVISSFRAGPKSSASSVSGLSAISGQSHSKPAYCYKTNCTAGYCTNSTSHYHQQQQHNTTHYQQPPTADLLGTGYQCQPSVPPLPPPQYPIYHIATGNNSQTTRLIWNNGNGTSSDGFTIDGGSFMPLSNAPISDSGSVYQTIY